VDFPQDDPCRFLGNLSGECTTLGDMFRRFEFQAMGQGTAAEATVPIGKVCMQFPCKGKAPVNQGIAGLFPAKDHPNRHYATGYGATGTTGTTNSDGES
jgi:hypothetical protein